MSHAVVATSEAPTDHDHIVVVRNATWADFQRHLEMRGDASLPRMTYLEGRIELMKPSRYHESMKSMIGRLVEAWCFERGVDITPYGSWLLAKKEAERGVEPDECYVVGDVPEPTRPDLAIEVIWTSGGVDELEVHRRLGVGEVWIYQSGDFRLFRLEAEHYAEISTSEVLPGIDLEQLSQFVPQQPMTRAVRAYREALRGAAPRD